MRKLSAIAKFTLLSSFVITSISPVLAMETSTRFPDVDMYHDYSNEIHYLKDRKVVDGWSDGEFKPGRAIGRAEITKMLIAAKYPADEVEECITTNNYVTQNGDGSMTYANIFTDVRADHKFAPHICMAKVKGISVGYSTGEFRMESTVSFGEATTLAIKTMDAEMQKDLSIPQYVDRLVTKKSVPDTVSNPNNYEYGLNRGEAAHIIQRTMTKYETLADEPARPAPAGVQFMVKPRETKTVSEKGITVRAQNHGIHCTTSRTTFVDLAVTKDGQTQYLHLERTCTGLSQNPDGGLLVDGQSTQTGSAFGMNFELVKVVERVAYQADTFEYYVMVK